MRRPASVSARARGSRRSRRRRPTSDDPPARRPRSRASAVRRMRCGSFWLPSMAICAVRCTSAGLAKRAASSADVGLRIEPRICRQGRDRFGPKPIDEAAYRRVGEGCRNGLVAGEQAEIGDGRMRAVEQPSFISSKGCTSLTMVTPKLSQRGRPGREMVLDHPLHERLGHHRPGILDAERCGNRARGRRRWSPARCGRPWSRERRPRRRRWRAKSASSFGELEQQPAHASRHWRADCRSRAR